MLTQIFVASLIFISLIFTILNLSIIGKEFTCNRYILNTYLYIILSFNLVALSILFMDYYKIRFIPNIMVYLGIFLISLACIVLIHNIDSRNLIIKHIIWTVFILSLSVIFYPIYNKYKNKKYLIMSSVITTLFLFIALSFIAYIKPEWISMSIGPILLVLLFCGILFEVLTYFINRNNIEKITSSMKFFSCFFIGLFMIFILYDTKRLQINARECINADYIKESLGLFLDIFNIFVRILGLR